MIPSRTRGHGIGQSRPGPVVEHPYPFGETRAVLIEDLDGLALELIEAGAD